MSKRINWLDDSRGIAFLMVLYSHSSYCNTFVMRYFSPIFLTTFFFVSGYLFKSQSSFKQIFEHRVRTLLLPFLIYGLLNLSLSQILTLSNKHTSFTRDLVDFFIQIRGRNDGLWFIACLFISTIPFYFLVNYIKSTKWIISCSSVLFVLNGILKPPTLPWHIQLVPYALFYMSIGYIYKRHEQRCEWLDSAKIILFGLPIYISLVSLDSIFQKGMVSFNATSRVLDGWILTLVGILLCVTAAKWLDGRFKLITFVGSNSLLYFALHGKCDAVLQYATERMITILSIQHWLLFDFIMGIAMTFLVPMVLIAPIVLINRYLPCTTGKGFKLLVDNKDQSVYRRQIGLQ